MGMFMGVDDMYIGGLLEVLNLRFGIYPSVADVDLNPDEKIMQLNVSGVREVQAIQAEVEVFKAGRKLVESMRALGVGGHSNNSVKRKWFTLLNRLDRWTSSTQGLTGGDAIVAALIDHLKVQEPLPVHFKAHDSRTQQGGPQVLIIRNDRPLFYMEQDFLTISLPMSARVAQAPGGAATPPAPPAPTSIP